MCEPSFPPCWRTLLFPPCRPSCVSSERIVDSGGSDTLWHLRGMVDDRNRGSQGEKDSTEDIDGQNLRHSLLLRKNLSHLCYKESILCAGQPPPVRLENRTACQVNFHVRCTNSTFRSVFASGFHDFPSSVRHLLSNPVELRREPHGSASQRPVPCANG
ncbi:Filamin/ABP280 repeat-containing protein [Toxoplasma gondii TgCatPRC2]|uniref:Filamin/ABP280 repeat-containing protein n=1 Tax=Toxoplasma gondii TgCatPRC2 TaxID=1130821 RepID=A0A151HP42_TOXGO|nr:Filamin/ABP280 repeat-containing protein [Toxoplasma gondii TgCatPRC2]